MACSCPLPGQRQGGGCRFKLQLVAGKPRKLRNGKLWKPKPVSTVARATVSAGKSAFVILRPKLRFAARISSQSRVLVKRARVIEGRTRTDFPWLAFVG